VTTKTKGQAVSSVARRKRNISSRAKAAAKGGQRQMDGSEVFELAPT